MCGTVVNYQDLSSKIQLSTPDFFKWENYFTEIDSTGAFKIKFTKYYPGQIWFRYNKSFIKIYVHPGDSIVFNYDAASFPESEFEFENSTFPNQLGQEYEQIWKEIPYAKYDSITAHGSFSEFTVFIDSEEKRLERNLQDFIKSKHLSSHFISWAKTDIKFHSANELIRYRWLNPYYNGKEFNKVYPLDFNMDFLNNLNFSNIGALNSEKYNDFLQEYYVMLLHDAYKEGFIVSENPDLFEKLDYINSNTEGIIHDYFLAIMYGEIIVKSDWRTIDTITSKLFSSLAYEPAREFVRNYYETAQYFHFNKETLITKVKEKSIKTIINEIISENKGKLIYINIWAVWCSPCITSMPRLREMQDIFTEDDISFVGFIVNSNEMKSKEIISKYNLKGKQYFLSKNQSEELKELIGYSGIPRYVLIDNKGNYVSRDALVPGTQLKEQLQDLLEE